MFHFVSGYTAKVAGTELGVTEPTATFSACFGQPFLLLHPTKYAEVLSKRMRKAPVQINTASEDKKDEPENALKLTEEVKDVAEPSSTVSEEEKK